MVVSSIDIGTNTVRLLVAELYNGCKFNFLIQQSKIARLGEGLNKTGLLKKEAIKRAMDILQEYVNISLDYGSNKIIACATSAVREAKNRDEFLSLARALGIDVRVLSPQEEARITHKGITYFVKERIRKKRWVAFDLGGGSTEFMFSEGEKLILSFSVPVGVVKLLEQFVKHDPPLDRELEKAGEFFSGKLMEHDFSRDIDVIVGNAGTVTTLAAIDLSLEKYSYSKTEGFVLTMKSIQKTLNEIKRMTSKERLLKYSILQKGREDVIVVGAEIVKTILKLFGKDHLIVTNGSLREGILIEECCNG